MQYIHSQITGCTDDEKRLFRQSCHLKARVKRSCKLFYFIKANFWVIIASICQVNKKQKPQGEQNWCLVIHRSKMAMYQFSDIQEYPSWIFHNILDTTQKEDSFPPINKPMIISQSYVHHRPSHNAVLHHHGSFLNCVHT